MVVQLIIPGPPVYRTGGVLDMAGSEIRCHSKEMKCTGT